MGGGRRGHGLARLSLSLDLEGISARVAISGKEVVRENPNKFPRACLVFPAIPCERLGSGDKI